MGKKIHFFIVDDDQVFLEEYSLILTKAGFKVSTSVSSINFLPKIIEEKPDCVLCALLLTTLSGLELFHNIRQIKIINPPQFILLTSKQYKYDKQQAYEMGVIGHLTKPLDHETFVDELLDIIQEKIVIEFWGCRGTLPVPGRNTLRYGGNTNCVTFKLGKKHFFIFDAGTGIKALSNFLVKENKLPLTAKIFISHPHYDHINGLPFFIPLYRKGNKIEILGANQDKIPFNEVIANQMDSVYFPITMEAFSSKVIFRALGEESYTFEGITIKTMYLNHPGRCLGFRVEYKDKIFCYITDNELYLENSPNYNPVFLERFIHFIQDANLLVIDCTYSDEAYLKKIDWGHSCVSRVADVADKAKVKLLCLYHHDLDEMDNDIDFKVEVANALLRARHSKTDCIAPQEGQKIIINLL